MRRERETCLELSEGFLERCGGQLFEREIEDVAVRAESFEGPGEVSLGRDAERAAGGDDAEEHTSAMRPFGAAGEEHVETELGDVLELALGRRVVYWDEGIVDEAKERSLVIEVVVDRRRERLGWQERGLHGVEPAFEIADDGANVFLSRKPSCRAFSSSP